MFKPLRVLYLHQSALDLYIPTLQKGIKEIPEGFLQLDERAKLVIINYLHPSDTPNSGIVLACGYHFSEIPKWEVEGLTICMHTPGDNNKPDNLEGKVFDVRIKIGRLRESNYPSFRTPSQSFFLSSEHVNLDEIICDDLYTQKRYEKESKPSKMTGEEYSIPF